MRVLNIGSLNIDYVYRVERFARPGETLSAVSMQAGCGGKGLNQSAALARAGAEPVRTAADGRAFPAVCSEMRTISVKNV